MAYGAFRRLDRGPEGRAERPSLHDRSLIVERRSLRSALCAPVETTEIAIRNSHGPARGVSAISASANQGLEWTPKVRQQTTDNFPSKVSAGGFRQFPPVSAASRHRRKGRYFRRIGGFRPFRPFRRSFCCLTQRM